MVRSMMSQTTIPKSFWDYALNTAARILNMVPTKKVDKTPYEIWHGQSPKLSYLKVWGYEAFVKRYTLTKPDKLDPRSFKTRRALDRMCLYIDAEEHELGDLGEPANYKAALLDPESKKWLDAMNVEMQSMKDNDVWVLFKLPPNARTIAYIEKILKRFYMENSKRGTILMQEKLKLSKSQGASTPAEKQRMQNIPYASAIGSIIYDVRCTHPDVAFVENITSRFQKNSSEEHWTAVKNILKYLRNTKDMFLVYGGAVDWKSTKQSIFETSSTDAEYIAAFDASKEAVWIRKFIFGLGIVPTIEELISMYCDNTGAISIAKDDGITKGARHFRAKVHYLRETIKLGDVKIEKIDTDDNLADPFTKALAFLKHSKLTRNIGLLPASSFM
nr:hypothetical protein [Tanacetum cinerariifolium]